MSPYRDEPIVTLTTFETEFEASLARGALEAAGIRAMVPGEVFGTYSRNPRFGRIELKVFASDRDRALVELRRLQMRLVEPPGHDE